MRIIKQKAYCDLGKYYKQYNTVYHFKEFVNTENSVKIHTNTIEGIGQPLKKMYLLDVEHSLVLEYICYVLC